MQDPVREIMEGMEASAQTACAAGIPAGAIVLDPGIGFGKAAEESIAVLKSLNGFSRLGYPISIGTSRKSFIRTLTPDGPEARSWGTAATIVAAIMNGTHIVRVHDVKQSRVLADVTDRML
jgi:dihydropteroate synthase